MASNKEITLTCPDDIKITLEKALRLYAEAAHPPGGSECSMVARESLLNTADKIHTQNRNIVISRRIKAKLKAAVDYYFEYLSHDTQKNYTQQKLMTLDVLAGKIMTEEDYRQAVQSDQTSQTQ